jgi:hypothetical protein
MRAAFPIPVVDPSQGGDRLPRAVFCVRAGRIFGDALPGVVAAPGRPRSPARADRVDLPDARANRIDVARSRGCPTAPRLRCNSLGPRRQARARLCRPSVARLAKAVGTFRGVA